MKKLCFLLAFVCGSAFAQSWPAKPVKLIVTYPPGGSSDLMSRVYGAKLAELWGQQVVIESKPGAAGSIGMDFAAKQPNDGYTFVVGNLGPVEIIDTAMKSFSMLYGTLDSSGFTATGPRLPTTKV